MIINLIKAGDDAKVRTRLSEHPEEAMARDENGVSAALVALYYRREALAREILALRPELDVFEAASFGDRAQLRAAIEADRNLVSARSPDGFTALHLAAFFGRADCVELLIDNDADVNAVANNPMKVQPLHSAAAAGHFDCAALLLDAGATANAQQQAGFTPLHARALHGDERMVQLLLEHGADPTQRAEDGRSAIDMAKHAGHERVAAILVASIKGSEG